MATLGNIRKRSGLLLAVIGIAMLAFILGDFMQSQRVGGSSQIIIGEIEGEKVMPQDFQNKVDEQIEIQSSQNPNFSINEATRGQIRNQVWNQFIRDILMNKQFKSLGIALSDKEWMERLSGANVHPEISKIPLFQDPNTGQFDGNRALMYVKGIMSEESIESRNQWISYQEYLIKLIKQAKYDALISKSMHITDYQTKISAEEKNNNIVFNYVKIPYSSLADSSFAPSDKEIKDYYKKNKSDYKQIKSKDIDYVVFEVVPSIDDEQKTIEYLNSLLLEFSKYEDYENLVRRHSDVSNNQFIYSKKESLLDQNWQKLFDEEIGTTIGPYLHNEGNYRIAKLVDVQKRADSVSARHILISNERMTPDSANTFLNQLKKQFEAGVDFGELAQANSDDKGSAIKGGDLGWFSEGRMVDEFNEVCFTSAKGQLKIVETQFGVHLIQVVDHSRKIKKIKVAHIDRNVSASTETFEKYHKQARKFAGELMTTDISFDSLINTNNLVKRNDYRIVESKSSISGLPNSREIVKWVNQAKKGDVSEIFEINNSLVVCYLLESRDEGYSPLNTLIEEISSIVMMQKKYDHVKELYSNQDLENIATSNSTTVQSAKTNFSSNSITGVGFEPKLIGKIFGKDKNNQPVQCSNSIIYFQTISEDSIQTQNQNAERIQLVNALKNISAVESFNAIKDKSTITDNRAEIY